MNLFQDFAPQSRVWVYQSNRLLLPYEVDAINAKATAFTNQWTAHQHQLKADFVLHNNLFLLFCVDENTATASGCSIDKSVHLVQQLEKDFNIRFLDRMMAAYQEAQDTILFNSRDLNKLYASGAITSQTIVYNNLVNTLEELNTKWLVPLHQSWMAQLMPSLASTK